MDEEGLKKRAANSLATQIRDKIGIHGLSKEENEENRRKGLLAKGYTLWTGTRDSQTGLEELEYALKLMTDSSYIHQHGKLRNIPDYKKIAEKLNEVFHQGRAIRNGTSVRRIREKEGFKSNIPKHPNWTDSINPTVKLNELDYLLLVIQLPSFQKENGKLDYDKITAHLNNIFHEGMEVRTIPAVTRIIGRSKR